MSDQQRMKIGELAERSELSQRTIHFYERSGLIAPAFREGAGYRYYDSTSLGRLKLIARLKSIGLCLQEIREILPLYDSDSSGITGKEKVLLVLRKHLKQTDEQLSNLSRFRDEIIGSINRLEIFVAQAKGDEVSVLAPTDLP